MVNVVIKVVGQTSKSKKANVVKTVGATLSKGFSGMKTQLDIKKAGVVWHIRTLGQKGDTVVYRREKDCVVSLIFHVGRSMYRDVGVAVIRQCACNCRILSRTFPCLSPNIGLQYSILLPLAKTVCVSVRKNSVDVSEDKK